jgi:hypothetical protein
MSEQIRPILIQLALFLSRFTLYSPAACLLWWHLLGRYLSKAFPCMIIPNKLRQMSEQIRSSVLLDWRHLAFLRCHIMLVWKFMFSHLLLLVRFDDIFPLPFRLLSFLFYYSDTHLIVAHDKLNFVASYEAHSQRSHLLDRMIHEAAPVGALKMKWALCSSGPTSIVDRALRFLAQSYLSVNEAVWVMLGRLSDKVTRPHLNRAILAGKYWTLEE